MKTLDPKIIQKLAQEMNVAPKTIRNNISLLAQQHPNVTPNALAQIYAVQNGKSILRMLSQEDRRAFPSVSAVTSLTPINHKGFRISVQTDKEPEHLYNIWWVQLIIAFLLVGVIAGTISQVLGIYFATLLGLIKN